MTELKAFLAGFATCGGGVLMLRYILTRLTRRMDQSIDVGSISVHSKEWREKMIGHHREEEWKK